MLQENFLEIKNILSRATDISEMKAKTIGRLWITGRRVRYPGGGPDFAFVNRGFPGYRYFDFRHDPRRDGSLLDRPDQRDKFMPDA